MSPMKIHTRHVEAVDVRGNHREQEEAAVHDAVVPGPGGSMTASGRKRMFRQVMLRR